MTNEDAIACLRQAIGLLEREGAPRRSPPNVWRSDPDAANPYVLLEHHCRFILRASRKRKAIGGLGDLVSPAWHMLIYLFLCHLTGREVSVTDACAASIAPSTTAHRYLNAMEKQGIIERRRDEHDRRKAWLSYTDKGFETMYRLLLDEIRCYRSMTDQGDLELPNFAVRGANGKHGHFLPE